MKNFVKNLFALSIILVILIKLQGCNENNVIPNNKPDSFETIKIGSQVWMKKNLDVDHYRNGDSIPQVTDPTQWVNLTTGAWCYHSNDSTLGTTYGKLYNWYAVNDPRGLAPMCWHVPSDNDWTILTIYLGGENISGGKMKDASTLFWDSPNTGATNESGFTGLPGGGRNEDGLSHGLGQYSNWWSSTTYNSNNALYRHLGYNSINVDRWNDSKVHGFSVRCIKD